MGGIHRIMEQECAVERHRTQSIRQNQKPVASKSDPRAIEAMLVPIARELQWEEGTTKGAKRTKFEDPG